MTDTPAPIVPDPSTAPAPRLWGAVVAGALTLVVGLAIHVPWDFTPPDNFDNSWEWALHAIFDSPMQFGTDVVFTYGPLGFLDVKIYHPSTWMLLLLAWTYWYVVFWLACREIAARAGFEWISTAVWVLTLTALLGVRTAQANFTFVFAPLLVVLYFSGKDRPRPSTLALLTVALALASLSKFSYFVAALCALLPITADEILRRRRVPRVLPLFGGALFLLFLGAGQRSSSFIPFLRNSLKVASGYTDAMSYVPPRAAALELDTPAFLILGVALLVAGGRLMGRTHPDRARRLLWTSGAALIILLTFKAGYVRHDRGHSVTASVMLLLLALLYIVPLLAGATRRMRAISIGVVAACAVLAYGTHQMARGTGLLAEFAGIGAQVPRQLFAAVRLLFGPSALHSRYEATRLEQQARTELPPVTGSVDVYTNDPQAVIFRKLNYQPRPVLQSYCAYTPELADLNVQYLRGTRAPDSILFGLTVIDTRFPALEDGPSWPELLTRYDLTDATKDFLLLRRSPRPRAFALSPLPEVKGSFGQPILLPAHEVPLWATVEISTTPAGRLLPVVYRNPLLFMVAKTRDGRERTFRFVAGMGRAGFLLSPVITDEASFTDLAGGERDRLRGNEVTALTFTRSQGAASGFSYRPEIKISLSRLQFTTQDTSRVLRFPKPDPTGTAGR